VFGLFVFIIFSSFWHSKMKVNFLLPNKLRSFIGTRSLFSSVIKKSDEVTKLIRHNGYKGEVQHVKTDDGYILAVHRIRPNKKKEFMGTAFLMHGLFRNSADFLATGSKTALPYLLSDRGFDVYLGNARGSKYSTTHTNFSYQSKEFWNFSFHEIGCSDLPAMIEYAMQNSNVSNINYCGHSQGCTSAMALLATRPSFNSLFKQIHLMAPPIFMNHATSPAFKVGSNPLIVRTI
jgi:pimeloyl-ACP methyl ester carboxylesterase